MSLHDCFGQQRSDFKWEIQVHVGNTTQTYTHTHTHTVTLNVTLRLQNKKRTLLIYTNDRWRNTAWMQDLRFSQRWIKILWLWSTKLDHSLPYTLSKCALKYYRNLWGTNIWWQKQFSLRWNGPQGPCLEICGCYFLTYKNLVRYPSFICHYTWKAMGRYVVQYFSRINTT